MQQNPEINKHEDPWQRSLSNMVKITYFYTLKIFKYNLRVQSWAEGNSLKQNIFQS